MRKLIILILITGLLIFPVSAMDYTAPEAPDDALELMPEQSSSFAADLWTVITAAMAVVQPALAQGLAVCGMVFLSVMLLSFLKTLPGKASVVTELVGVLAVAALMLNQTNSMLTLARETVTELSEYGKLLLPVMAAAMAAQGGVSASTALYAGTVAFDTVLTAGISKLMVPMVYIYLILSVAAGATGENMLAKLRDQVKWLVSWCLKTVMTVFTGYMGITGVVSGNADAAAVKATRLTMSGMVPVVGGVLSEASEAVIVSAGVMKSAVGVYGLVALIAIWITPFIRLGVQYLLLKLTAALCEMFDLKAINGLVGAFSSAMGLLLGMTGAVCVMLLISVICFMKGVA